MAHQICNNELEVCLGEQDRYTKDYMEELFLAKMISNIDNASK